MRFCIGGFDMRRISSLVVVIVAFAICLAIAVPALALLEDPSPDAVHATSTYNPALGDDVYWRWQWGNTLDPDMTFTTFPADTPEELQGMGFTSAAEGRTQTTGFIYEMRQVDNTGAEAATPTLVPGSSPSTGRNIDGTFQGELKTLLVGTFDIRSLVNEYGWLSDPTHPAGSGRARACGAPSTCSRTSSASRTRRRVRCPTSASISRLPLR